MFQSAIRCALVLCTLAILCAPSSTEARRRGYYYQYYRNFEQNAATDVSQNGGSSVSIINSSRGTGFGATVDQLIRGCSQEAIELKNWPFDYLAQMVGADETQRDTLQKMQNVANTEAGILSSKCPKEIPAAPSAKLDTLQQGLDAFLVALDAVRPAVEQFYTALNDEQKARLVAIYVSNNSAKDRPDQLRRSNRNAYREGAAGPQELICERWASALREWPTRQIEANMTLSDIQHAALYELTASMYRTAATLITLCRSEISFTPLGQIDSKRKRIDALAQAIRMIRPGLGNFSDTLDNEQKIRFAKIISSPQVLSPRRRSDDDD